MTLEGVDISHYQGLPDMNTVKNSGRRFVFAKATEGTTFVDPTFATQRHNCYATQTFFGAYHFARNGDPIAEADFFSRNVGPLNTADLVALDWEVAGNAPAYALPWLQRVESNLGVKPGVYLNNYYLTAFDWSAVAANGYWLWYARYNGAQNDAPASPFPVTAFKQYSANGSVPGISGAVDLDVFYGDENALAKYGKQGKPNPIPVPTPPPAPVPIVHVVRSGENVTIIARNNGVTAAQVIAWNHLPNGNYIQVGQRLIVGWH